MSFIRSTSNPERLYVWGDAAERVTVNWAGPQAPKPPLAKGEQMVVPWKTFYRAAWQWDRYQEANYRGFRVMEMHIFMDTGKRVPDSYDVLTARPRRETGFLYRISYKDKFVFVWKVTWAYVVHQVIEQVEADKKRRRRSHG
jgi:hypothetical protein